MPHEIITFGEAMIRLSLPNFRRLEQTHSLDVQVGGATEQRELLQTKTA